MACRVQTSQQLTEVNAPSMPKFFVLPWPASRFFNERTLPNTLQAEKVATWFGDCQNLIRSIWHTKRTNANSQQADHAQQLAQRIAVLLTQHKFNFQSRGKVRHLLGDLEKNLQHQIKRHAPIRFFLLYNGGYRASPAPQENCLIFEPDQTELMLLYQIARLDEEIRHIYPGGIEFSVVINNGVAWWVNGIGLQTTQAYANDLRQMITSHGGSSTVRVILQSELPDFDPDFCWTGKPTCPPLAEKDHLLVERFLGRACSLEESACRAAMYTAAEQRWGQTLQALAQQCGAVVLRQVSHPDMLSFRPFPGGAIRVQNGSLGFEVTEDAWRLKLITAETVRQHHIEYVPYQLVLPHTSAVMSEEVCGA